ncbi:MAG: class I SAM-dependent methyltransferase, partial [Planctomycetes bacterium]|nr:class I SAM-dependent methyltransferase [Planctomycetota bacterium]
PDHYFIDVGCGSLRGGVHFIPYLDSGHYLGIDKEEKLIQAGIEKELGQDLFLAKKPKLVVSDCFEFEKFGVRGDYAIAQSLFTHLPGPLIETCLKKLRKAMNEEGVFFATFFHSDKETSNPDRSHDHGHFVYTAKEMDNFGIAQGWKSEFIGDWGHPRRQFMIRYRPARL